MKKKGIYYLFSFVLLTSLIGISVGIIYKLSNGFKENIPSFILTDKDGKIIFNKENVILNKSKVNIFYIKNINQQNFECNIYGNSNYSYLVDGIEQSLSDVKRPLNDFFNLSIDGNCVSIKPDYLPEEIIKKIYSNNEIEIIPSVPVNGYYFTCVINTKSENYEFSFMYDLATKIELDFSGVVF